MNVIIWSDDELIMEGHKRGKEKLYFIEDNA